MKEAFSFLFRQLGAIRIVDVIDILLVAVLLYYVIAFFRERRAGKLAVGVVFLVFALIVSNLLEMYVIGFILQTVVSVGVLALVILFQPELRSMLEKMGRGSLSGLGRLVNAKGDDETILVLEKVCEAVSDLSQTKTGALIVLERESKLGDEIRTGTVLDAEVSPALIRNVFYNKAPLHDGAMILRDDRIFACGCFLPLSTRTDVDGDLGTRHRAALGVSEICDAVVIIVSEETGTISIARDAQISRGYDRYTLENELRALFAPAEEVKENRLFKKKAKSTPALDKNEEKGGEE